MLDRVVERAAQAFDRLAEEVLRRRSVHASEGLELLRLATVAFVPGFFVGFATTRSPLSPR